jgi:ribosomal protein S4
MKLKFKKKTAQSILFPLNVSQTPSKRQKKGFQKRKASSFKVALLERQKFRRNFLLTKGQMSTLVDRKSTMRDVTETLLFRLDIFLFNLYGSNKKFKSLRSIRQLIRHGYVFINGVGE